MTQQRNHRISDWLYHTSFFTRFYERMAGQFGLEVLWKEFQTNYLNKIPDGATLLEVGAGPGLFALRILKSRPSLKIVDTDNSPKMLELAQANLAKASSQDSDIEKHEAQLVYVQANAMDLSQFSDREIDGIYSMGAAKHFPDPVKCLLQARDILTNGGLMYFTDFCSDGKYSGTRAIVAKLNLSAFSSVILRPIIHFGLKKEAPTASEVKSWTTEFRKDSGIDVHFSFDGSVFVLTHQKTGGRHT